MAVNRKKTSWNNCNKVLIDNHMLIKFSVEPWGPLEGMFSFHFTEKETFEKNIGFFCFFYYFFVLLLLYQRVFICLLPLLVKVYRNSRNSEIKNIIYKQNYLQFFGSGRIFQISEQSLILRCPGTKRRMNEKTFASWPLNAKKSWRKLSSKVNRLYRR